MAFELVVTVCFVRTSKARIPQKMELSMFLFKRPVIDGTILMNFFVTLNLTLEPVL